MATQVIFNPSETILCKNVQCHTFMVITSAPCWV